MKLQSLGAICVLIILTVGLLDGCVEPPESMIHWTQVKDSIQAIYAPDKRVAWFDVELKQDGKQLLLSGVTDQQEALQVLLSKLHDAGETVVNQVTVLPDSSVGDMRYAVVNNSVCNIRSEHRHSAELATQALLGMTLKVLQRLEEWYLVQSPDGYISWVDHGGVQLMTGSEQLKWSKSPKVVYLRNYGNAYGDTQGTTVLSDLVLGDCLVRRGTVDGMVEVQFPDRRIGYVPIDEVADFRTWRESVVPSGELVVAYAQSLLGSPYLWGGTSTKGMDCSGFTKMAYLMNGYIIPRDASQQVHAGTVVDPNLTFEGLEKGDLLFFGRAATDSTRQRVTHVGLWMGDSTFIHSSQQVRISSVDSNALQYDEFNKNRYLGSRRYLGTMVGISHWY
ncbi:hypothetical protein BFP72_07110 [Reichenbachiella sp. 5M10]|uniref:C40 family peptidase n=1 Tax=Reichenbachiella sp. 5M10 TaxID=1889772 RepID=UPI000C14F6BC|nr:C40 family peptidase [Reichenbachiella sp. 5M10]PIB35180.1 hypothetical protein BFP72_07110 [Reichenbachiella sp. 5M10]